MDNGKILVVEDDPGYLKLYSGLLGSTGYVTNMRQDPNSGLEALKDEIPDLVLLDLTFNGTTQSGLSFITEAMRYKPDISIIVISAQNESGTIMKALDLGAVDYIVKDHSLFELLPFRVSQTLQRTRLEKQVKLQWELNNGYTFDTGDIIVGKSPEMVQVFHQIENVAWNKATVLIVGESGTGKELVARAIHARKGIPKSPFVSIDCGAVPKAVLESELFGVRAKYPGFHNAERLIGKFEAAGQGTLLLDEIGNMEVELQAKLLRVLEERQFMPIGNLDPISLRAQVIASTNIKFDNAIQAGRFREDLYYRLNDVRIIVPSLRDRKKDIPLLVNYFLEQYKRQSGKEITVLPEALEKLESYDWPGNVRELGKTIQRAIDGGQSHYLTPKQISFTGAANGRTEHHESTGKINGINKKEGSLDYRTQLAEFQKSILLQALDRNNGNQTKTAEELGLNRQYFLKLLKTLGLLSQKDSL